jgi:hypothetical protein
MNMISKATIEKNRTRLYPAAFNKAVDKANQTNCDVGLEFNPYFGEYSTFILPRPEKRCGHELRCQVVRPGEPKMKE